MTEILVGTAFIVALVLLLSAGLLLARKRLLPDGAVRISLNGEPKLEASRGAVLLGVLQDAGVPLPAACGGKGTCGLCRVTVTGDGAGAPRATEKGLLSAAELRSDLRLACQVSLRGAVDVDLPSELLSAESVECRVRSNRMLAPLIRELVLDVPAGHEIAFRAGGFMQLHAPPYRLDFADIDLEEPFREAWRLAGWNRLASGSDFAPTCTSTDPVVAPLGTVTVRAPGSATVG